MLYLYWQESSLGNSDRPFRNRHWNQGEILIHPLLRQQWRHCCGCKHTKNLDERSVLLWLGSMLSSHQIFARSHMGSDYHHLPGENVQSGGKCSSRLIRWLSRNSPDRVHSAGDNLDWWNFLSRQLSCRNRNLKTIVMSFNHTIINCNLFNVV